MIYKDLQDVFVHLTFILRGFDYSDKESPNQELVKLSYERQSQPFQDIQENISYVWVNYADSATNKQINERLAFDSAEDKLTSKKFQLRNLDVHWIFYGDGAMDTAYYFRQNLFKNLAKTFLDGYGIKLIPDVPEVVLIFEEINNIWWPRTDLVVRYYIETEVEEDLGYIESVKVELSTENKTRIIKEE